MIRILTYLNFIPSINRLVNRKYYATGIGTYIINTIAKRILRISSDCDILPHFTSRINKGSNILIKGDSNPNVYLSFATSGACYYQALNGIEIGEGVLWSYGCQFISANHSKSDYASHEKKKPIVIGDNVWLGSHVIILPGVTIGNNCVIGAGAVVTKDIPDNSTAVGNPAKVLVIK